MPEITITRITLPLALALGLTLAAPVPSALAQTVVNADRALINERGTFGGSTFGDVLRVIGAGTTSAGTGTMNPWVLDADGDALRDTATTVTNAGGWTFGVPPRVSATFPWLELNETDAAADEKAWRWSADGGMLRLSTVNDAGSTVSNVLLIDRVGQNPPRIVSNVPIQSNATLGQEIDYTTLRGFQNVEIGRRAGGPAVRLENGSTVWNIDVNGSTWRLFRDQPTVSVPLEVADDITLRPAGNDVLPGTGYQTNLGMLTNKFLSLHAAELWVETLVAQNTMATIGGRVMVSPTNILTRDLLAANFSGSFPTQSAAMCVKYNSFQLHVGGIEYGSKLLMEANGKFEAFYILDTVTPAVQPQGDYCYSVYRNQDNTGTNDWYAGDAVLDTGKVGSGYIDLYSVRGLTNASQIGPSIAGMVRTGGLFNNLAPRWAIGNLNGLYGYGVTTFGFAAGDPSGTWTSVDATNGWRLMNGAVTKVRFDPAGNGYLAGVLTIDTTGAIKSSGVTDISTGAGFYLDAASSGRFRVGDPTQFRIEWNTPSSASSLKLISPGMTIDVTGINLAQSGGVSEAGKRIVWTSGATLWDSSVNNSFQILRGSGTIDLAAGASSNPNDGIKLQGGITGVNQSYLYVTPNAIVVNSTGTGEYAFRSLTHNTMKLGTASVMWSQLWLTESHTTNILYPLVSDAGQVKAKTDGSTIGFTCPGGQAVKSMTIEFGIVVGVACGVP
jgi:hypothetical protein